ncbi:MAG TPA: NAD-dependent epimerase/dehydratase family protein [Solirubrobacteraceae bacterium]|jgi:UDP-glucose 4-epimerase|nr:NAD-dependent epimerase/dehydratase family protein [Solirubrobacteraceae bacterium]
MRALVTGGAGFIGSNLVDALVDRGDDVAVLDDLSSGKEANVAGALERGARLHRADIRDAAAVADVFGRERPEVVFHLAAQIDVRVSVARPAYDARTNVEGTINVLEGAREAGARRLVFASTGGAIYGETDVVPTPEGTPPRPMAGYGQSKFCAEAYLGLYERLHGLSTVALRFGNVYGPRQDPHGEAGVIAIFCGRFHSGGRPTVFGDGRQTRDYIYVGDLVDAALTAGDADVGGAINIGTAEETTVLELIDAVREAGGASGGEFEPEFADARLGEVERSCLDVSRAREVLGWQSRVDVREGVRRTLAAAAPAA